MGQKTFESIGTALPNRYNIVISNEKEKNIRGCVVVNSIQEAIEDANFINNEIGELKNEIFVIGGGSIYKQFIPYTSKMYVTRINCEINGDTYFPHINDDEWRIIFKEDHKKDDKNQYDYTYEIYERQN
jgi:dihydrofolate reductase